MSRSFSEERPDFSSKMKKTAQDQNVTSPNIRSNVQITKTEENRFKNVRLCSQLQFRAFCKSETSLTSDERFLSLEAKCASLDLHTHTQPRT